MLPRNLLAGIAGTAAMTIAMGMLFRLLPRAQQYPLPPRQITMKTVRAAGVEEAQKEPAATAVTAVAHFGYGAAVGALYGPVMGALPLPPVLKGSLFGLAVWAGSYYGWVPALGLLPPPTEWPARRHGLMVAAHLVWGITIAGITERGLWAASRSSPCGSASPHRFQAAASRP